MPKEINNSGYSSEGVFSKIPSKRLKKLTYLINSLIFGSALLTGGNSALAQEQREGIGGDMAIVQPLVKKKEVEVAGFLEEVAEKARNDEVKMIIEEMKGSFADRKEEIDIEEGDVEIMAEEIDKVILDTNQAVKEVENYLQKELEEEKYEKMLMEFLPKSIDSQDKSSQNLETILRFYENRDWMNAIHYCILYKLFRDEKVIDVMINRYSGSFDLRDKSLIMKIFRDTDLDINKEFKIGDLILKYRIIEKQVSEKLITAIKDRKLKDLLAQDENKKNDVIMIFLNSEEYSWEVLKYLSFDLVNTYSRDLVEISKKSRGDTFIILKILNKLGKKTEDIFKIIEIVKKSDDVLKTIYFFDHDRKALKYLKQIYDFSIIKGSIDLIIVSNLVKYFSLLEQGHSELLYLKEVFGDTFFNINIFFSG